MLNTSWRSITSTAPAVFSIVARSPGVAKRNGSGEDEPSLLSAPAHSSTASLITEKKGLADFGPQTTKATQPLRTTTLSASPAAAAGSAKNIADSLPTATSKVPSANGRSSPEHWVKEM